VPADHLSVDRRRRYWDSHAAGYDRQMQCAERYFLGDSRAWVCSQATGRTLEVAIGTGLNLAFYPAGLELVGVDLSPAMLALARRRAAELGRTVDLREADALALPFPDASFDTVVCTFGLCAVPDDRRAVAEAVRMLRPGGLLLLADHIEGAAWLVRAIQRLIEVVSVPLQGEHALRRPLRHVEAEGLEVLRRERFKLGLVERLTARKPVAAAG
jgi:ubiquinone/menaquinone biosynthesis C-methylase UbiE